MEHPEKDNVISVIFFNLAPKIQIISANLL